MHDAGQPAKQGQQDVQPKVQTQTHLQKHAERWKDESKENADDVQKSSSKWKFRGQRSPRRKVSADPHVTNPRNLLVPSPFLRYPAYITISARRITAQ